MSEVERARVLSIETKAGIKEQLIIKRRMIVVESTDARASETVGKGRERVS